MCPVFVVGRPVRYPPARPTPSAVQQHRLLSVSLLRTSIAASGGVTSDFCRPLDLAHLGIQRRDYIAHKLQQLRGEPGPVIADRRLANLADSISALDSTT